MAWLAPFGRSGVSRPDGLSPRELQILQLVARGMSNREIGTTLVVSEHTAANLVRSILRKTGCSNRTEAAAYAYRRGLTATPGRSSIRTMPLFLIERSSAEQLELTDDDVRLSADRRRSYCLYEAPSAEEIMVAARRANVPVDEIVEVDRFVPEVARS